MAFVLESDVKYFFLQESNEPTPSPPQSIHVANVDDSGNECDCGSGCECDVESDDVSGNECDCGSSCECCSESGDDYGSNCEMTEEEKSDFEDGRLFGVLYPFFTPTLCF